MHATYCCCCWRFNCTKLQSNYPAGYRASLHWQLRRSTVKTSLRLGYGASIVHAIAMTRNNDSFVSKLFLATKYKCRPLSGVLVHRPRPSRAVEQSNRARSTYLPRSEPLPVVDAVVDLAEPELLEERVLGLTHEHAHPPHVDVEQLHRRNTTSLPLMLLSRG